MTSLSRSLRNFVIIVKSKILGPSVYTLCAIAGLLFVYLDSGIRAGLAFRAGIIISLSCFLLGNAMYNLNDVFDRESDRLNKRNKPLSRSEISLKDMKITVGILSLGSILPLVFLNGRAFLLGTVCLSIGIFYSLPPISLERRSWGKPFSITSIIMISIIIGGFSLGVQLSRLVFMAGSLCLFVSLVYHTHDIRDMEGDREMGCTTLPLVIGKKNTLFLGLFGYMIFAFLTVVGRVLYGFSYLFPVMGVIFSLVGIRKYLAVWFRRFDRAALESVRTINRFSIIFFSFMFPLSVI